MPVSKIWRIAATSAWFTPEPDCLQFNVRMAAGGGGGAGTSDQHFIPPGQYGKRGGDSYFHLRPAMTCMFACAPGGTVVYCGAPHNLVPDQAIFLEDIPTGVSLLPNKPYFPLILSPTHFNISETPYSPPFGGQNIIVATPLYENPVIKVRPTWYGVQGGGGGGIIGDQGTPLGYWGLDGIGPDGVVQSFGMQGGAGSGGYKVGGAGGVNCFGGSSGQSYQDFGIAGTNLTGAGGGGGSPVVTPTPLEWGGTGGAAGAAGEVWIKPEPGKSYFCWAGNGGLAGPAGPNGYPGGAGGHGQIMIVQEF